MGQGVQIPTPEKSQVVEECPYDPLRNTVFFFLFLVLQEYWVLTESRIPLKPVVGSVIMVALFISSHKQTQ